MAEQALWTAEELVAATGGTLHGKVSQRLNAVSIDSRNLSPGDIFVAIKGDVHDGHDFVAQCAEGRGRDRVVSRVTADMKAAGPVLEVAEDPLRGLENMGRASRARCHGRSSASPEVSARPAPRKCCALRSRLGPDACLRRLLQQSLGRAADARAHAARNGDSASSRSA
jgi:hypothetical protein